MSVTFASRKESNGLDVVLALQDIIEDKLNLNTPPADIISQLKSSPAWGRLADFTGAGVTGADAEKLYNNIIAERMAKAVTGSEAVAKAIDRLKIKVVQIDIVNTLKYISLLRHDRQLAAPEAKQLLALVLHDGGTGSLRWKIFDGAAMRLKNAPSTKLGIGHKERLSELTAGIDPFFADVDWRIG
ncbi:MAG: hypothetical protein FWE91_08835 [Defluviitaleaceae bacterium]|nr:hypothetical protein [Defluviitaleaceae bacterium]MCL2836036.1 hypothetical protein [Defluviitaleaceae bacterium]